MSTTVTLPVWFFVLILLFAAVTFASHFLFPSVRWFLRRRLEKAVAQINTRLERPIEPFKLLERHDTIQRLIYDPQVLAAVRAHAKDNDLREDVAFQHARRYAREIVPSFSASAYFGLGIRGARFLSNALYRVRLGYQDNALLTPVTDDATVVFVMNHRSNMDYVLVTYLAAQRSALSYAVGEWARIWPLTQLFKSMGAYFIRRKSRTSLYRAVLRRYVQMATENGVTQAMFPEGGLSLNGALSPPKLGLLSYILEGVDLSQRDVLFVPVALNYDRVLEDEVLIKADQAGNRRFKAGVWKITRAVLKQIWLRITGKFHKFGYAAVSFGAPVSLRAHQGKPPAELADLLMARIATIVPVLPVPLVTYILDSHGPLPTPQIETRYAAAVDYVDTGHVHMPRQDVAYAVKVGLRALSERNVVFETAEGWQLNRDKAPLIAFYANSVRHLFQGDAAAAV